MGPRFNPCGQVWTFLRSCYSFTMRLYIGGQEQLYPARWYRCAPGAKLAPNPHGAEASPYLKRWEVNLAWGEVTPYPQDPASNYFRGLDRGRNPGYAGQCFVGDPQWFQDGRLPANILDGPTPDWPQCCRPKPGIGSGGVLLGGQAVPAGKRGAVGTGGLVLGGSAIATGPTSAVGSGGVILGGAGAPTGKRGAKGFGGLVLGGTAVPSGPPSGFCSLCPGGSPQEWDLAVSGGTGDFAPMNGVYRLLHDNDCFWISSFGADTIGALQGIPPPWAVTLRYFGFPHSDAAYKPQGSFACLGATAWVKTSSNGTGTAPTSVITTPH